MKQDFQTGSESQMSTAWKHAGCNPLKEQCAFGRAPMAHHIHIGYASGHIV